MVFHGAKYPFDRFVDAMIIPDTVLNVWNGLFPLELLGWKCYTPQKNVLIHKSTAAEKKYQSTLELHLLSNLLFFLAHTLAHRQSKRHAVHSEGLVRVLSEISTRLHENQHANC